MLPSQPTSPGEEIANRLRQIPAVDTLLQTDIARIMAEACGHDLTLAAIRAVIDQAREAIIRGQSRTLSPNELLDQASSWLGRTIAPTLRPVINATGVIIHTNLGRAPLSDSALAAAANVADQYSTLEYDLVSGERGSRSVHAESLLTRLTGAQAALVVNNNAAAVLLMLSALCSDQEVIISRGQLIEIGGGFRVPDVMAQSGAKLVEVGTTNKTHLRDYEVAISERTAAILVAHHSNFKVVGFTSEPTLAQLGETAEKHDLLLLYDQGSGALLDTTNFGLDREPTVQAGLSSGADVVSFSGDKLLGGPQAGILCGQKTAIATLKKHPLARAVRADKLCLSALSATLLLYLTGTAEKEIPVWRMISRPIGDIMRSAVLLADKLHGLGYQVSVVDGVSTVGGGSLPGATLPTHLVALQDPQVNELSARLRKGKTPVVGRIADNRLLLDARTVLEEQFLDIISAFEDLLAQERLSTA